MNSKSSQPYFSSHIAHTSRPNLSIQMPGDERPACFSWHALTVNHTNVARFSNCEFPASRQFVIPTHDGKSRLGLTDHGCFEFVISCKTDVFPRAAIPFGFAIAGRQRADTFPKRYRLSPSASVLIQLPLALDWPLFMSQNI